MNKEQYVTFEVSKLLKNKGFDWPCTHYYDDDGTMHKARDYVIQNDEDEDDNDECLCPTQQMAMRWVWEEKGLNINAIYGDYPSQKRSFWMPQIDSLEGTYGTEDGDFFREYDSREDCIEAALEYVLTNLI
jgi:hypothetical protein